MPPGSITLRLRLLGLTASPSAAPPSAAAAGAAAPGAAALAGAPPGRVAAEALVQELPDTRESRREPFRAARAVQRDVDADWAALEAEPLARHLAGEHELHVRAGEEVGAIDVLAPEVGALLQHVLREELHRHELEVLDPVEGDHLARRARAEEGPAHLGGALLLDDALERRAAAHRVVHERERLALLHGAARLAQAVAALEVALGDEDHDHRRLLDVLLEGADVLEVVDVEEDGDAGEQQAELPLEGGALVLPCAPDVREEEVPLVVRGERELRPLARREEAEGGHPRGVDDGLDGEHDGEGHRAEDADKEAAADDELVEVEAVVQLARLERLRDGLDLEHGAEEEDGREREVARDREVVVLLLAVGRGDGGYEHEDHREDHRHAQLHDGVVAHADHDAHEEELLELLGDLPAVHARLEVAVQEGERRGEA